MCFAFLSQAAQEEIINNLQTENELQKQKQVIRFKLNSSDECVNGSYIMYREDRYWSNKSRFKRRKKRCIRKLQ